MNVIDNGLPWIIFTLKNRHFAVNSKLVSGIIKKPQITAVPNVSDYFEGTSEVRGGVIPIINLRRLLKLPDAKAEIEEECEALRARLHDHEKWFAEFKRCAETGDKFTMPLDPHKCSFGQWYDNFESENQTLKTLVTQIDEPHLKFHRNAEEILESRDENGQLTQQGKQLLAMQEQLLEKKLRNTMDDIIDQLCDEQYRMIVTLSRTPGDPLPCMGVTVDSVTSVDNLELVDSRKEGHCLFFSHYVCGIARSNTAVKGDELMILDSERLLELTTEFASQKAQNDD